MSYTDSTTTASRPANHAARWNALSTLKLRAQKAQQASIYAASVGDQTGAHLLGKLAQDLTAQYEARDAQEQVRTGYRPRRRLRPGTPGRVA